MLSEGKIFSFKLNLGDYNDFLNEIIIMAKKNISSYVCVANVHMFIEAYRDENFLKIIDNADLVTPDGMPLVVASRKILGKSSDRVAGMDLLPDLLNEANKNKFSIFLYGGTNEMLNLAKEFILNKYPNIQNLSCYAPPFRPLTFDEEKSMVELINKENPNLVFAVLGCPKQEKWMSSMKGKINCCMVGIGGALPVMLGMQRRAPQWMQKYSLEWLFRFIQDPKRLFKRYFVTNSIFLYLIIIELIKLKILKVKSSH